MKVHTVLELSDYTKIELISMYKLGIITETEVKKELLSRGMCEWSVITMMRVS